MELCLTAVWPLRSDEPLGLFLFGSSRARGGDCSPPMCQRQWPQIIVAVVCIAGATAMVEPKNVLLSRRNVVSSIAAVGAAALSSRADAAQARAAVDSTP